MLGRGDSSSHIGGAGVGAVSKQLAGGGLEYIQPLIGAWRLLMAVDQVGKAQISLGLSLRPGSVGG